MSDAKPTPVDSEVVVDVRRRSQLLTLSVVALTLPAAYFQGTVLQRWGDDAQLGQHVAAIDRIPQQIGDWRFVADGEPIHDYVIKQLELRKYTHRLYEHRQTGQRLSMLLLVGPAGPLVRHPPEICYQTRANQLLRSQDLAIAIESQSARLRLLEYQSSSVVDGDFFVAYAFGADGRWDVPDSPRLAFGGRAALFKLQVLSERSGEPSATRPAGLTDFLGSLLPALNHAVDAQ
jgi:hypothetical protein